jgi:hypothetical protein
MLFIKKGPEVEVTLLRPWLHPTIWCFDAPCFYVFIFAPYDGATEHRNMSG